MPSTSRSQHNLMEVVKHSASFAKKVHIPQAVGRDFVAADKAEGKFKPRVQQAVKGYGR